MNEKEPVLVPMEDEKTLEAALTWANMIGIVAGLTFARPKWSENKMNAAVETIMASQCLPLADKVDEALREPGTRQFLGAHVQRIAAEQAEVATLEKMLGTSETEVKG